MRSPHQRLIFFAASAAIAGVSACSSCPPIEERSISTASALPPHLVASADAVWSPPVAVPTPPATTDAPRSFARMLCGTANATSLESYRYDPMQGLAPAEPRPDYVRLWVRRRRDNKHFSEPLSVAEAGWRCNHTVGEGGCSRALERKLIPALDSSEASLAPFFLVEQRSETQRVIASWPELAAFLGPIDTLEEAALHAVLRGYEVESGRTTGESTTDGWLLEVRHPLECRRVREDRVRMRRDGEFSVLSSSVIETDDPTCWSARRS